MMDAWRDIVFRAGVGWAVADHLWQSTVCVALAAVLVWLAGPGRPALRHAVWLGASIKFLVPFSFLVAAGEVLGPVVAPLPVRPLPSASVEVIGQPFTSWAVTSAAVAPADASLTLLRMLPIIAGLIWALGTVALLAIAWNRWRRISTVVARSARLGAGREVDAVRRVLARRHAAAGLVTVRQIAGAAAPALFGLRRAALLWPAGLSARLRDDELEAIVAHELAHFRRRDNLAALVHSVVEAAFWFHPLVWWMSRRLVEERERACDQEALDDGVAAETYAETLLSVCRFGLAVPQPLVASAAGSSLGQRVEAIMDYRPDRLLTRPRGVAAGLAVLLMLLPFVVGIARADAIGLPDVREVAAAPVAQPDTQSPPEPAPSNPPAASSPVQAASPEPANAETDAAPAQRPYRGGGITALRTVQPTYTVEARQAGVEGRVELEALILEDGTVGQVRIVKSLDREFGLDEQAIKAARLWLFRTPVDATGKPMQAIVTLILDFRLQDRGFSNNWPRRELAAGSATSRSAEARQRTPLRDSGPDVPTQEDLEFRQDAHAPSTPGLTEAKAIRTVPPTYTSEAMRAKVQGSVEVEIVVGMDGVVERARVTRSLDREHGLDAQALRAVRQWYFTPATLNGQAVETWMRLTLDFRLY
jgi:TonB family protein